MVFFTYPLQLLVSVDIIKSYFPPPPSSDQQQSFSSSTFLDDALLKSLLVFFTCKLTSGSTSQLRRWTFFSEIDCFCDYLCRGIYFISRSLLQVKFALRTELVWNILIRTIFYDPGNVPRFDSVHCIPFFVLIQVSLQYVSLSWTISWLWSALCVASLLDSFYRLSFTPSVFGIKVWRPNSSPWMWW